MKKRFAALWALAFACLAAPASAQNAQPVDHPVYEGLLPADFQMAEAPQPMDRAAFRGAKIVIVPSANFNDYADTWQQRFDPEAINGRWTAGLGIRSENLEGQRQAADPRLFSDAVITAVSPHFREVAVAQDLISAREAGAQYYLVVDYWAAFSRWGGRYRSHGGVHLLDSQFRHVLSATGEGDVRREEGNIFEFYGGGGMQSLLNADARTYANGLNATMNPVIEGLRRQLGPTPQ
jgi:hypothetical protein